MSYYHLTCHVPHQGWLTITGITPKGLHQSKCHFAHRSFAAREMCDGITVKFANEGFVIERDKLVKIRDLLQAEWERLHVEKKYPLRNNVAPCLTVLHHLIAGTNSRGKPVYAVSVPEPDGKFKEAVDGVNRAVSQLTRAVIQDRIAEQLTEKYQLQRQAKPS